MKATKLLSGQIVSTNREPEPFIIMDITEKTLVYYYPDLPGLPSTVNLSGLEELDFPIVSNIFVGEL